MKNKKKFRVGHIFLILLGLIVLTVLVIIIVNAIRTPKVVKAVDESDVLMTPTIDFVQPSLLIDYSDDDYDRYFSKLEELGYDTLIMQFTRSESYFIEDNESVHGNEFYYPTEIVEDNLGKIVIYDVLERFLDECAEHNFSAFVGLSVEEYSWWTLIDYYNNDYMEHCKNVDLMMIEEIYELYGNKEAFIGWYFAFELFSNPIGWEKIWAKNVKAVIEKVDEIDELHRPVMMSPFRQIQLGLITNEYAMWCSFFERAGLRDIDIFCPQDSIGKVDSSGNLDGSGHETITDDNLRRIADYTEACAKACEKYNIHYYINCELFRAVNGESANLFDADIERVIWQIKNASNKAEKLVTFSASHYMIDWSSDYYTDDSGDYILDEDGEKIKKGIDTLENRNKFFNEYKEFIELYK